MTCLRFAVICTTYLVSFNQGHIIKYIYKEMMVFFRYISINAILQVIDERFAIYFIRVTYFIDLFSHTTCSFCPPEINYISQHFRIGGQSQPGQFIRLKFRIIKYELLNETTIRFFSPITRVNIADTQLDFVLFDTETTIFLRILKILAIRYIVVDSLLYLGSSFL